MGIFSPNRFYKYQNISCTNYLDMFRFSIMTRIIKSLSLPSILSSIKASFEKIPDSRNIESAAYSYQQTDILMSGLAMMFTQEASMSKFQKNLQNKKKLNNLKTIFSVSQIPENTQFRDVIDLIPPDEIQKTFLCCQQKLQKTRTWHKYRVLGGRYAILIDATGFYHSNTLHCEHCLTTKHRNGEISYSHKTLVATIAHPDVKAPIPMLLEEIRIEDGYVKQDCEINAAKRLLPKLAKQHPKLDMICVGDGLYSKEPMIDTTVKAGLSYIYVAKPGDHVALEEDLMGLRLCNGVKKLEIKLPKGSVGIYEWCCKIHLNNSTERKVNWFSYTEIDKKGKRKYRNSWVTDINPNKSNIVELASVGRQRWQIENQAFNILKNGGYNLEHNFGHGKQYLAFNFIILNFLAYMTHQLMKLTDNLYQRALEFSGTRKEFWEKIRVLTSFFVWASWQVLLEFILELRKDMGFDSG